jgi:hypothetical protein
MNCIHCVIRQINRQLDLLSTRAQRIDLGPCRDSLIRRIEQLNRAHHTALAKLAEGDATRSGTCSCMCRPLR